MEELSTLVDRVRRGDSAAYEIIVQRFQDMAVGYSYALLGDIQLAEDAAQEAFINAYFALPSLRDPAAFPGWFRQIVFKQVDRLRRDKRNSNISLNYVPHIASPYPNPAEVMEIYEGQHEVFATIETLPESQSASPGALRLLPEMPQLLLEYGADINARDSERNLTPLGWAETRHEDETDRSEVIGLLREYGAKTVRAKES